MADKERLFISWSDRSTKDTLGIKEYLQRKFSQKEIDNLYNMLEAFEKIILIFPELYPKSTRNGKVHRAVLSKQLSVFYTLSKDEITVVAVLDNRMDYSNWP
jgi:plasmid stabilization system protein ParE